MNGTVFTKAAVAEVNLAALSLEKPGLHFWYWPIPYDKKKKRGDEADNGIYSIISKDV